MRRHFQVLALSLIMLPASSIPPLVLLWDGITSTRLSLPCQSR